jgi:hypothetical protein
VGYERVGDMNAGTGGESAEDDQAAIKLMSGYQNRTRNTAPGVHKKTDAETELNATIIGPDVARLRACSKESGQRDLRSS